LGHATVEITHSFNLGGFRRPSELLRNVATTAALPFDHTTTAHLHRSSEMISHETMIGGAGRMKRLDFRETPKFGCAVAASIDVSGRVYAHTIAADCAAERHTAFERWGGKQLVFAPCPVVALLYYRVQQRNKTRKIFFSLLENFSRAS